MEHRNRHKADYALVVAPGFSEGAIVIRCTEQRVTPITARDLGRLLEYTVEFGAIPVTKLQEMFALHDPAHVSNWVDELRGWLDTKRPLTIATFIRALDKLKGKVPDILSASIIAYECRESLGAPSVKEGDVIAVARGLAVLLPDLVGVDEDRISVNATAEKLAEAVRAQLEALHQSDSSEAVIYR